MQVQYGSVAMIQPWMALVEEIRGNFPGLETPQALEEHRQTVLRFMEHRQALCVRDGRPGRGRPAVFPGPEHDLLPGRFPGVQAAGDCLPAPGGGPGAAEPHPAVTVSTFREQDPKGAAPRALYRKFGFREGPLTQEFGYPNQVMVLPPAEWRPTP